MNDDLVKKNLPIHSPRNMTRRTFIIILITGTQVLGDFSQGHHDGQVRIQT